MTRLLPALLMTTFLGACAMQNHSYVNNEPMRLQHETVNTEFTAAQVSKSELNHVVDDVTRRGTGPVTVTVHYSSDKNVKNSQRLAEAQGNHIKNYLVAQGLRHPVQVMLEPVDDENVSKINVTYDAMKALAPKDCQDISMADADQFTHNTDSGYRYGCSQDYYLSQMIARPADLAGNDTVTPADSQRLGKSLDTYRAGERATSERDDQGLSASNVYRN